MSYHRYEEMGSRAVKYIQYATEKFPDGYYVFLITTKGIQIIVPDLLTAGEDLVNYIYCCTSVY